MYTLDADDRLVCILLLLSSPSEPLTVARHWPRLSQCESIFFVVVCMVFRVEPVTLDPVTLPGCHVVHDYLSMHEKYWA